MPTLLLYNEKGLKLFEKITYLEEYYLTRQEIEVLETCADRIADRIALKPGAIVVELGSGYGSWGSSREYGTHSFSETDLATATSAR